MLIRPVSTTELSDSIHIDTPLLSQGFHHAPLTDDQSLTDPPLCVIPSFTTRRNTFNRIRKILKPKEQSLTITATDLTRTHEFTASYKLLDTYVNIQHFDQSSPKFQNREQEGIIQKRSDNNILYCCHDLSPAMLQQFEWYIEGKCPFTGNDQAPGLRERSTELIPKVVSSAAAASVMACENLLHHAAKELRQILKDRKLSIDSSIIFAIYKNQALRALVKNHLIHGILDRRVSKEEVSAYSEFQQAPELLGDFQRDWDELCIHAAWKDSKKRRETKKARKQEGRGKQGGRSKAKEGCSEIIAEESSRVW